MESYIISSFFSGRGGCSAEKGVGDGYCVLLHIPLSPLHVCHSFAKRIASGT